MHFNLPQVLWCVVFSILLDALIFVFQDKSNVTVINHWMEKWKRYKWCYSIIIITRTIAFLGEEDDDDNNDGANKILAVLSLFDLISSFSPKFKWSYHLATSEKEKKREEWVDDQENQKEWIKKNLVRIFFSGTLSNFFKSNSSKT